MRLLPFCKLSILRRAIQMKFVVTPYFNHGKSEKSQFRIQLRRKMFFFFCHLFLFFFCFSRYCKNIGLNNRFYHHIAVLIRIEKYQRYIKRYDMVSSPFKQMMKYVAQSSCKATLLNLLLFVQSQRPLFIFSPFIRKISLWTSLSMYSPCQTTREFKPVEFYQNCIVPHRSIIQFYKLCQSLNVNIVLDNRISFDSLFAFAVMLVCLIWFSPSPIQGLILFCFVLFFPFFLRSTGLQCKILVSDDIHFIPSFLPRWNE